jgi:hypothetical protein
MSKRWLVLSKLLIADDRAAAHSIVCVGVAEAKAVIAWRHGDVENFIEVFVVRRCIESECIEKYPIYVEDNTRTYVAVRDERGEESNIYNAGRGHVVACVKAPSCWNTDGGQLQRRDGTMPSAIGLANSAHVQKSVFICD